MPRAWRINWHNQPNPSLNCWIRLRTLRHFRQWGGLLSASTRVGRITNRALLRTRSAFGDIGDKSLKTAPTGWRISQQTAVSLKLKPGIIADAWGRYPCSCWAEGRDGPFAGITGLFCRQLTIASDHLVSLKCLYRLASSVHFAQSCATLAVPAWMPILWIGQIARSIERNWPNQSFTPQRLRRRGASSNFGKALRVNIRWWIDWVLWDFGSRSWLVRARESTSIACTPELHALTPIGDRGNRSTAQKLQHQSWLQPKALEGSTPDVSSKSPTRMAEVSLRASGN